MDRAAELDVVVAKAGAKRAAHLKAGILAGYQDMKRMTATVRQPRTAAAEPQTPYSLNLSPGRVTMPSRCTKTIHSRSRPRASAPGR